MEQVENRKFEGITLALDGKNFKNCEFLDCVLEYHAKGPFRFENCRFDYCQWESTLASADAIAFIRDLYSSKFQEPASM